MPAYQCNRCKTIRQLHGNHESVACPFSECYGTGYPVPASRTIKELEAVADDAVSAREAAQRKLARIDRILAAMTLIADSLSDGPWLGRAIIEAINKADNAQSFAELTAIRKAIADNLPTLDADVTAAEAALNEAPEAA